MWSHSENCWTEVWKASCNIWNKAASPAGSQTPTLGPSCKKGILSSLDPWFYMWMGHTPMGTPLLLQDWDVFSVSGSVEMAWGTAITPEFKPREKQTNPFFQTQASEQNLPNTEPPVRWVTLAFEVRVWCLALRQESDNFEPSRPSKQMEVPVIHPSHSVCVMKHQIRVNRNLD